MERLYIYIRMCVCVCMRAGTEELLACHLRSEENKIHML